MRKTRTAVLALAAAGALLAAGCTAGDSTDESGSDTTDGGGGSTPTTVLTGPSPGVTDDSIKVGVNYVDLESLGDVVDISHGDYEGSYMALFDAINEAGGINGRTIDPVLEPINPVGTDSADAACVELTEDEDVFVVMGFFLGEGLTCPLVTHETATISGTLSPQVQEQAGAVPWFTEGTSSGFQTDIVRAMAEAGELDGTLGVFAGPAEQDFMNDEVLPALEDEGIDVAESAVVDAPPDDLTAVNAAVATIAQRFDSSGVDQVLVVGTAGLTWASGTEATDYRPKLLFTDFGSVLAYASDEGRDLSALDGAVGGGLYGGAQNQWELPSMQECIGTIQDAGVDVDEPDSFPPGASDANFTAPFNACRDVTLLTALLEAAGEDLNYGTFAAGAEGLEVDSPVQPDPMVYGSGDAADGDPTPYLFDWDPDEVDFVLREN